MVYKKEFHGPDITLNFLIAHTCKVGVQKPDASTEARGIPQAKKDDITYKLTILMPENRRIFWKMAANFL